MPEQQKRKEDKMKESRMLIKIADILLEQNLISMEERLRFREYIDKDAIR